LQTKHWLNLNANSPLVGACNISQALHFVWASSVGSFVALIEDESLLLLLSGLSEAYRC